MKPPAKVAIGLAILATLTVVLLYVRMVREQGTGDRYQQADVTAPALPPEKPLILDAEGTEDKSDKIRVFNVKQGDVVESPLTVEGEARGSWFFEASFPVVVEDGNGKVLASHYAEAQGEWMTADFVPFKSTLAFTEPTSPTGTLILKKDNPSGLPEHDDEIRILVRFVVR